MDLWRDMLSHPYCIGAAGALPRIRISPLRQSHARVFGQFLGEVPAAMTATPNSMSLIMPRPLGHWHTSISGMLACIASVSVARL
jgi:hypothetical protein